MLQNKALRIITKGKFRDHLTLFYAKQKILKLLDLFKYEGAKFMHKFSRNKSLQLSGNFLLMRLKFILVLLDPLQI